MVRKRAAIGKQQGAYYRRRNELGVIAVVPFELFPYWGDLAIILEISQRIVPVAGNSDFFAGQASAVFQAGLANHRPQAGQAEIGSESEVVLPRAD
jgi:hypothetical protein